MIGTRAGIALLVLAVVVVLGVGAPVLDDVADEQPGTEVGDDRSGTPVAEPIWDAPSIPTWVTQGVILGGLFLFVVYVLVADDRWDLLVPLALALVLAFFVLFVLEYIDFQFPDWQDDGQQTGPTNESVLPVEDADGEAGEAENGTDTGTHSPYGTLFFMLSLFVLAGVLLYRVLVPDEPDEDIATGGGVESTGTGDAVGRVAGRAADRIGEASFSNAIYEAWHGMTTELDVTDPKTTTTGEFANAAVDAGMDPEDVETLTALFEEVRYGDADVTPQRERRAERTLRRIEETYTGAESGSAHPSENQDDNGRSLPGKGVDERRDEQPSSGAGGGESE